jgi:GH15 family glucan-1,4-alpha-glucosidase
VPGWAAPIEDYALIGDCQTAALISRAGSIDWLCFPRFDSGACFAALLGRPENGRWLLAPEGEVRRTTRRYRGDTLVLETVHETGDGAVRVVDCMPVRSEQPDLVRVVTGLRGRVAMKTELVIRFDYGSVVPWVRRQDHGIVAVAGPENLRLRSDVPLHGQDLTTVGRFSVAEGEQAAFVLTWYPSTAPDPPRHDPHEEIAGTEKWWSEWAALCTYQGEWREAVMRSLITLKALTYMPTGGLVAAATTSLPERLAGERNWDYRYCWLRDATFALVALMENGYFGEAKAWQEWLLRAVAGKPSQAQIMYGVAGERRLTELLLPWLPGYQGIGPVRIGNAAHDQFQLDVYGELMDTLHLARSGKLKPEDDGWRVQQSLLKFVESAWREPDEGIWEMRGGRRHFTHSKVMAWVAFDRAVQDLERFQLPGPVDRWRALRAAIHEDVCRHGFDPELNSFVQSYGSKALDASLLMLPCVGFLPPDDPRVRGTVAAIERRLLHDGFVYRYEHDESVDGLPPGEGVFLLCTFWLADTYAMLGRWDEARAIYERMLAIRNDVGLLSEEYEPSARRLLGNFPQAFSHVGLVNTAGTLTRRRRPRASSADRDEPEPPAASGAAARPAAHS